MPILAPMHMLTPSVEVTYDDAPAAPPAIQAAAQPEPAAEAWPGQEVTRAAAPAEAWPGQEVTQPAAAREPGVLERVIGRPASIGVRNVAQGALGGMLDMLNNAGAAVGNIPGAAYDAIRGNTAGTSEPFQYNTIRRGIDAGADAIGAARPETPTERFVGAVSEGAAGTVTNLPAAAAGAARVAPGAAREVLQAIGSGPAVDAIAGAAGGAAQEGAARLGAGDTSQLAASFGGGALGGILAQAVMSAAMARRGPRAVAGAPLTPDEIAGATGDVLAAYRAAGMSDAEIQQVAGAFRVAEAQRARVTPSAVDVQAGAPATPEAASPRMRQDLAERTRPVEVSAAELPRPEGSEYPARLPARQPGDVAPDTLPRRTFRADPPRPGALVPAGEAYDPRIGGDQAGPRQGAEPLGDDTIQRLARVEERLAANEARNLPPGDPSGANTQPVNTVPEGRLPQTPEQAAGQREAGGAFDLAQRQRERDSADPATRDTQAASATPQGPQRVQVYLDEGYPVRIVRDLGEGTVSVERYDPRTDEGTGQPYTAQRAALTERTYTLDPRAAQDMNQRSQGPVVNAGRARGRDADQTLGMPRQTFRVTPDDPADTPRTSRDAPGEPYTPRSDRPQQAEGEAPGGSSRSEQRYRTWQEAAEAFAQRERERAQRDSASGDQGGRRADSGYSEQTSNKAADIDPATGRYPLDPGGNIRSSAGGAIKFANQKQAGLFLVNVVNKSGTDQIPDLANHPSGDGFTIYIRGHGDRPPSADAEPRNAQERGVLETIARMKRGGAQPRGQKSLTQFVKEQGGIKDERGDIRNMMGAGTRGRPGLLNNATGLPADQVAERAHAAGYFPEHGRPETQAQNARATDAGTAQDRANDAGAGMSTRAFIEALDEDLNGSRQRFGDTEDADGAAWQRAMSDLERELDAAGVSSSDPPETILAALRAAREEGAKPDLFNAAEDTAPRSTGEFREGDDPPFYASPIADPKAWKKYVGEPLGKAMRAIADSPPGAAMAGAARMGRAMFYSADGELRATPSAKASETFRAELDNLYSTTGRDDGVGRTFDEAVHKGVNESLLEVDGIEKAMTAAGVAPGDLRAAIVGGSSANVPASLLRDTRAFLARLLKLQRDAGVELGDVGSRYFPREFDTAAVFKNANAEQRFLKAAEAEYRDPAGPGLDAKGAHEAAVTLLTSLKRQQMGHITHGGIAGRGDAMNTKGREFAPAADKRMADFYVQDTARVLGAYALRAVKRAEIARRYGEPQYAQKEVVLPLLKERMAKMHQEGASTDDLELLRSYVGSATGITTPRNPPALDWLRTWATLGNLNTSLIINMSEVLMPAVRAGNLGGAIKDVAQVMRQFGREIAKLPREDAGLLAERLGVIAGQGHNTIMQARFGVGDTQSRVMADIQTKFYRGIGMEQLTNATRAVAAGRGTEFIRDMALAATGDRKFLGLFGDQNRARFYLRELGVKAGQEDAFAAWVKNAHDADYPTQILGSPEGQAWQTAVGRFVDQTSLRPNAATRPRWASHPYGSILFNLSSYPYAFGKQVIGRVVNLGEEAVRGKGYSPVERAALLAPVLLPLAGFAVAQVALQNARSAVTGDPEIERRKTDNRRLQDVADRSGLLGGAQPWLNLLGAGLEAGRGGATQQAAGPAAGMPLQVINTLLAALGPGNAATNNTAERATAKAAYRGLVEPAANLAASMIPGGGLAMGAVRGGALLSTGLPAARDGFVDGVAGPQSARARRQARNQSIYGLGDSLPGATPTRRGIPVSGR